MQVPPTVRHVGNARWTDNRATSCFSNEGIGRNRMAVPAYRRLTDVETEFITWLLEHSSSGAEKYLPQLASAQVRSSCTCGCPSIAFSAPQNGSVATAPPEIIADFTGAEDGLSVGLILFAREGVLSELEAYPYEDAKRPFRFPPLESLAPTSLMDGPDSTGARPL
jgi:hypothetical protein